MKAYKKAGWMQLEKGDLSQQGDTFVSHDFNGDPSNHDLFGCYGCVSPGNDGKNAGLWLPAIFVLRQGKAEYKPTRHPMNKHFSQPLPLP